MQAAPRACLSRLCATAGAAEPEPRVGFGCQTGQARPHPEPLGTSGGKGCPGRQAGAGLPTGCLPAAAAGARHPPRLQGSCPCKSVFRSCHSPAQTVLPWGPRGGLCPPQGTGSAPRWPSAVPDAPHAGGAGPVPARRGSAAGGGSDARFDKAAAHPRAFSEAAMNNLAPLCEEENPLIGLMERSEKAGLWGGPSQPPIALDAKRRHSPNA